MNKSVIKLGVGSALVAMFFAVGCAPRTDAEIAKKQQQQEVYLKAKAEVEKLGCTITPSIESSSREEVTVTCGDVMSKSIADLAHLEVALDTLTAEAQKLSEIKSIPVVYKKRMLDIVEQLQNRRQVVTTHKISKETARSYELNQETLENTQVNEAAPEHTLAAYNYLKTKLADVTAMDEEALEKFKAESSNNLKAVILVNNMAKQSVDDFLTNYAHTVRASDEAIEIKATDSDSEKRDKEYLKDFVIVTFNKASELYEDGRINFSKWIGGVDALSSTAVKTEIAQAKKTRDFEKLIKLKDYLKASDENIASIRSKYAEPISFVLEDDIKNIFEEPLNKILAVNDANVILIEKAIVDIQNAIEKDKESAATAPADSADDDTSTADPKPVATPVGSEDV